MMYSTTIVPILMSEVVLQTPLNTDTSEDKYNRWCSARDAVVSNGNNASSMAIARLLPVSSPNTICRYSVVWKCFFDYVEKLFKITDIDALENDHIEAFLRNEIAKKLKLSSYKAYSSAFSKLEIALNKRRKKPLNYSDLLIRLKAVAVSSLSTSVSPRSYNNPEVVISTLTNEIYQIAANLQLLGGARLREISDLQIGRNLTGIIGDYGFIQLVNAKGGKSRTMRVPADLYRKVEEIAKANGAFKFSLAGYTKALNRAFDFNVVQWHGCHGLRWNYAQNRFLQLQRDENKSFNEALQIVATELGHTNPKSTLHYLR